MGGFRGNLANELDPVDRDEVLYLAKLRVPGNHSSMHPTRRSHRKGIGIRDGESSLNPGCLEDIGIGIGDGLDRQRLQPAQELFGQLLGSRLCRHIVHLPDIDLIHQERLAGKLGSPHQLSNLFEPFFFVEEGEHGERIEQTFSLHVAALLADPSAMPW